MYFWDAFHCAKIFGLMFAKAPQSEKSLVCMQFQTSNLIGSLPVGQETYVMAEKDD